MKIIDDLADSCAGMSHEDPIDCGIAIMLAPCYYLCLLLILPFYFIGKLYQKYFQK